MAAPLAAVPALSAWTGYARDFAVALRDENKSPNTVRLHTGAVDTLATWCAGHDGPADPCDVEHEPGCPAGDNVLLPLLQGDRPVMSALRAGKAR